MIYLISIRRWCVWRGDKDDESVTDKKGFNHMHLPSYILQFSFGFLSRFSESCKIKFIKPKDSFHLVEKDKFVFFSVNKVSKTNNLFKVSDQDKVWLWWVFPVSLFFIGCWSTIASYNLF